MYFKVKDYVLTFQLDFIMGSVTIITQPLSPKQLHNI